MYLVHFYPFINERNGLQWFVVGVGLVANSLSRGERTQKLIAQEIFMLKLTIGVIRAEKFAMQSSLILVKMGADLMP